MEEVQGEVINHSTIEVKPEYGEMYLQAKEMPVNPTTDNLMRMLLEFPAMADEINKRVQNEEWYREEQIIALLEQQRQQEIVDGEIYG